MNRQHPHDIRVPIDVVSQQNGICKTGLPFPIGTVISLQQLTLLNNEETINCSAKPLNYWPDGSIKWLSLLFQHTTSNDSYQLVISPKQESCDEIIHSDRSLEKQGDITTFKNEQLEISIDHTSLSLCIHAKDKRPLLQIGSLAGKLSFPNMESVEARLDHWQSYQYPSLGDQSNQCLELRFEGHFTYQTEKLPLRYTTTVQCFLDSQLLKVENTLHNPNPAKHPGGLWDLGDPGSEKFESFVVNLSLTDEDSSQLRTELNQSWLPSENHCKIVQSASGGDNWQSPVHVNQDNQVTLEKNGYEVVGVTSQQHARGRATPTLHTSHGITLTLEKFWQNYPSALTIEGENIELGLFPRQTDELHELQGGEKKSHTYWLSLANGSDSLNWVHTPPIAKPASNWLIECQALPGFHNIASLDPIQTLIQNGINGEQNFFAKREIVDEYGWRNFGDLYADHETANYSGKAIFVTHYNNQYDPIYGFLKQFLLYDDTRWFELADDLASHVTDIDIYHTDKDKAEYNGGLFWHTDHYLQAHTATHRSFSKRQESGAYVDHASGGGPGGQHCYTTGLTFHHLFTGSEASKQAVLTLTTWIGHVYEGTNTCLELLLAIRNRHVPGLKNPFNGQYPFDRGTANYVVALLDSFELTQQASYLQQVEHIIQNTVHPADNIAERHLDNIEECWFYIVFLQAICRYLHIKHLYGQLDDNFYYARDALLHYADWMLENEYPYLDKPELLEFPNDAWTAQELRKTHVLAAAYYYAPEEKPEYLKFAEHFQQYVASRLSASEEATYTRNLVLLMQNHGALEYYSQQAARTQFLARKENWPKANYQKASNLFFSIVKAFGKRMLQLSPAKEINWLKTRIAK